MSYIATDPRKFVGQSIGNGQCVAFARAAAALPHTSAWRQGQPVFGATLAPGTAIATFGRDGRYANDTHGNSHAAIYLGQNANGIQVLDQWVEKKQLADGTTKRHVQNVSERIILFKSRPRAVNDGRNYYVIE